MFAAIEKHVHAKRPALSNLHGGQLLAILMSRIAHDAPQALEPEPCAFGPASEGYVPDDESVKAQRFLLRLLYPKGR